MAGGIQTVAKHLKETKIWSRNLENPRLKKSALEQANVETHMKNHCERIRFLKQKDDYSLFGESMFWIKDFFEIFLVKKEKHSFW